MLTDADIALRFSLVVIALVPSPRRQPRRFADSDCRNRWKPQSMKR